MEYLKQLPNFSFILLDILHRILFNNIIKSDAKEGPGKKLRILCANNESEGENILIIILI